MKFARILTVVAVALIALAAAFVVPAGATAAQYEALKPGSLVHVAQELTVNVVFVGFEQGSGAAPQVDQTRLLAGLPASVRPNPWSDRMRFDLSYNVVFADAGFADSLFAYLGGLAKQKPLTAFQSAYNQQVHRSRTVSDNAWIDAPSVERWLGSHASDLGLKRRDYTVFYLNWYGRPDFRFHIYSKTGEPEPDTKIDLGEVREYTKLVAFGGSTPDDPQSATGAVQRVWFYDFSAGPDGFSGNWNVDDPRIVPPFIGATPTVDPSPGPMTYRIPVMWDYGRSDGYRPFTDLTGDIATLTTDVAVNSFVVGKGSAPDTTLTADPWRIPSRVRLAVSLFNAAPGVDGRQFVRNRYMVNRLQRLEPWRPFTARLQVLPYDEDVRAAYESWVYWFNSGMTDASHTVYPGRPGNDGLAGDIGLWENDHEAELVSSPGDVPMIAFSVPDELATYVSGFTTGANQYTKKFILGTTSATERENPGYALTMPLLHEAGHYLGLPHPHDDLRRGERPQPFYLWTADEVNSIMSYVDVNWDFSQFDRDHIGRSMTVKYLDRVNFLVAQIQAAGKTGSVRRLLTEADRRAELALRQYQNMDYTGAATSASASYALALRALRLSAASQSSETARRLAPGSVPAAAAYNALSAR